MLKKVFAAMWCIERTTGTVFYKNEIVGQLSTSEVILLSCMLKEPSRVFTKDELLDLGWPGRIVAPNSLTVAIKNIRKVFGYRPSQLNIKTKHGEGYALLLPVENEIAIVDQYPVPVENEIVIVDQYPALAPDVDNEESISIADEKELIEKKSFGNVHGDKKFERNGSVFLRMKLPAMVGLFFSLLLLNIVVVIYDKKIYCETIGGVLFCGTRPLAYSEKLRLQNGQIDIDRNVVKYVYGYNYTTKNMVFYPLH